MAFLEILSRCQSFRDLDCFARHHNVLSVALGQEHSRSTSDCDFRYFSHQVDVSSLCGAILVWRIAQIPGGTADFDCLICDRKTLNCPIELITRAWPTESQAYAACEAMLV